MFTKITLPSSPKVKIWIHLFSFKKKRSLCFFLVAPALCLFFCKMIIYCFEMKIMEYRKKRMMKLSMMKKIPTINRFIYFLLFATLTESWVRISIRANVLCLWRNKLYLNSTKNTIQKNFVFKYIPGIMIIWHVRVGITKGHFQCTNHVLGIFHHNWICKKNTGLPYFLTYPSVVWFCQEGKYCFLSFGDTNI